MMFWNRKKLLTDTTSEALAKSCRILNAAGIACRVQTSASDAPMFGSFALNKVWQRQTHNYLYTLYVRRRDYARAKSLFSN